MKTSAAPRAEQTRPQVDDTGEGAAATLPLARSVGTAASGWPSPGARFLTSPEREIEAWAARRLATAANHARVESTPAPDGGAQPTAMGLQAAARRDAAVRFGKAVAALPRIVAVAARHCALRLRRWRAQRNALHSAFELAQLDDRSLRDIGLERGEILSAALNRQGVKAAGRTPRGQAH